MLIKDFYLGPEYEPPTSDILIKIPREYPQVPPGQSTRYGIYLTGGLRRLGRELTCERDEYHWKCSHNPPEMYKKGWAWWCFAKIDNWDPRKDNLLTVLMILSETLQNPERQVFG